MWYVQHPKCRTSNTIHVYLKLNWKKYALPPSSPPLTHTIIMHSWVGTTASKPLLWQYLFRGYLQTELCTLSVIVTLSSDPSPFLMSYLHMNSAENSMQPVSAVLLSVMPSTPYPLYDVKHTQFSLKRLSVSCPASFHTYTEENSLLKCSFVLCTRILVLQSDCRTWTTSSFSSNTSCFSSCSMNKGHSLNYGWNLAGLIWQIFIIGTHGHVLTFIEKS